jgi:hypothetical protein
MLKINVLMGSNSNDLLVEYQGNMYEWNNVSVRKLLFSKLTWVWEFLLYNMYGSRKKRVPKPTMNYNYNIIEIQLNTVGASFNSGHDCGGKFS